MSATPGHPSMTDMLRMLVQNEEFAAAFDQLRSNGNNPNYNSQQPLPTPAIPQGALMTSSQAASQTTAAFPFSQAPSTVSASLSPHIQSNILAPSFVLSGQAPPSQLVNPVIQPYQSVRASRANGHPASSSPTGQSFRVVTPSTS